MLELKQEVNEKIVRLTRMASIGWLIFAGIGTLLDVALIYALPRKEYWSGHWLLGFYWHGLFFAAIVAIGLIIQPTRKELLAYRENVADQSSSVGRLARGADVGISALYKDDAELPSKDEN